MLNFSSAPEILKDDIVKNFLELSSDLINNKDPLFILDNVRNFRNFVYSKHGYVKTLIIFIHILLIVFLF
jgi:hypothetical protein